MSEFHCSCPLYQICDVSNFRFIVRETSSQPPRSYHDIKHLLANSKLPPGALSLAQKAFALLAEAESAVHGVEVDQVHFHEVQNLSRFFLSE